MAEQFKADDYIVILRPKDQDSSYIRYGHCYKQKSNDKNFDTAKDSTGQGCGTSIGFERTEWWRYATEAEILEYQRENKPFDTNDFTPVETDNYQIF
jgi:hypothetical protein